jgi:translocation and assembly module TamB
VKWLKSLLLVILSLLLLVVLAVWLLLGTETGLRWGLEAGKGFVPGQLQLARIEGNLLGDLRLYGVSYVTPEIKIEAAEMHLRWQSGKLLHKLVLIDEFVLQGVRYEQLQAAPEEDSGPVQLADIELPVELQLKMLRLNDARIVTTPGSEPLLLDELLLTAAWNDQGLVIESLSLKTPEADFSARGRLDPRKDYPLDLDLDWQLQKQELPRLSGKGRVSGNLQQLDVVHQVQGDVDARLNAHLMQVLDALHWDADIRLTKLPTEWLPYDPDTADLDLKLDVGGDLNQASGRLVMDLQPLDQAAEQSSLKLNLDGRFQYEAQQFEVNADWSGLRWPLSGLPQIRSETGRLTASGIPDGYHFVIDAALRGRDVPVGDWHGEGDGNLGDVRLKLSGRTLQGLVQADGLLAWSPELRWDMNVQGKGIDPAELQADWNGELDLKLHARGGLPESGLQLKLDIEELAGSLRDRAIGGSGQVQVNGNRVKLDQLVLRSGLARIQANGELAESWDLQWQLDIPGMADLLPGATGEIQGQGQLGGSLEKPVIQADINMRGLLVEGIRCDQCALKMDLGLDPAYVSHATVNGSGMTVAAQDMDMLSLELNGPMSAQQLSLEVDHGLGKLTFAAAGALDQRTASWYGQVRELGLNMQDFGHWKMSEATDLLVAKDRIELSPLCLEDEQSMLCTEVQRGAKTGKARLDLRNFSLERLRPWLPPEIVRLTGMLDIQATADLDPQVQGRLHATLGQGELVYVDAQLKERSLPLHDGKVEAVYDDKFLSANWILGIGEDTAQGNLVVPRKALDADPVSAPLQGRIALDVKDLSAITAFVPDIEKIQGSANMAVDLGGRLGDPRIRGHARVQSGVVVIPRAGLELKDLLVEITGDGSDRLQINGGVRSGEGELQLSGEIRLDAAQGWPLHLKLGGRQFLLVNLPEARVLMTPDLKLEASRDLLKLRGRIGLPLAQIELEDLPAGSRSVSSDVVVLNEDGSLTPKAGSKVDAEITITLGQDVHLKGFGLNADLGGQLFIDQKPGKVATASGEIKIRDGSFRAYGQDLTIGEGRISYAGGRIDNPGMRLRASRKLNDITVGVQVSGTAKKPKFSTWSTDPDLAEKDIVSILLTGQRSDNLSEAKVYAGRQITKDLSVGVNLGGGKDGSQFVARYRLRDNVNLEGTSSARKSGVSINYTIEVE